MAPVMIASQRRPGAAELERGEAGGSGMGAGGDGSRTRCHLALREVRGTAPGPRGSRAGGAALWLDDRRRDPGAGLAGIRLRGSAVSASDAQRARAARCCGAAGSSAVDAGNPGASAPRRRGLSGGSGSGVGVGDEELLIARRTVIIATTFAGWQFNGFRSHIFVGNFR